MRAPKLLVGAGVVSMFFAFSGVASAAPPADPDHGAAFWLAPAHTYTYQMQAVDHSGNRSGISNTVSYTTPPDVTPAPRS